MQSLLKKKTIYIIEEIVNILHRHFKVAQPQFVRQLSLTVKFSIEPLALHGIAPQSSLKAGQPEKRATTEFEVLDVPIGAERRITHRLGSRQS